MDKLTSGKVSELLSPDYLDQNDERPIFDWATVIRSKSIVYVGLDALTDGEVAGAVGNSMFADLTSFAGRKYKHGVDSGLPDTVNFKDTNVCIHADEFNELIGDEFDVPKDLTTPIARDAVDLVERPRSSIGAKRTRWNSAVCLRKTSSPILRCCQLKTQRQLATDTDW